MIPTMILLGLVLGRWWWVALAAAAVVWPVVLVAADVVPLDATLLAAALLAAVNAGVGMLAHQAVLHAYRHLRHRPATP